MNWLFTGGDWTVFYKSTIEQFSWIPQVWSATNGNGFGQNVAFVLGYKTFFTVQVKFLTEVLNLPWNVVEQIIFFIPFWILAFSSSYFLSKFFYKKRIFNILSSIIFATNTYSLMLVGGGQMGVALAYALSPFVLLSFLAIFRNPSLKNSVITSFLLGFLICIDPRIAGIILIISFIFLLFEFTKKIVGLFFLSLIFGGLLNAFWILPFLFSGISGLTDAYTGTDILSFLSFAKLENVVGLLHPNWPENFFGKVGFMKSEFLLLPIIAFSVFLFKTDRKIKVFGIISVLGMFLSKGVNDPFGNFYYFLSDFIPGFTMFRDSTKWYLMVVISYSILIPLAISNIIEMKYKPKKLNVRYKKQIIIGIFLVFWIVTIRQIFLGQLTGTFKPKQTPGEYIRLEQMLSEDISFSRVLWVPQQNRFGYFSNTHPAVASYDFITSHDLKPTFKFLNKKTTEEFVKNSAINYVIIPYDPLGEMYLTDRKYDRTIYDGFLANTKKISWLKQDTSYKKIGVFKVLNTRAHTFDKNTGEEIKLTQVSATKYKGEIAKQSVNKEIVFSEAFDKKWVITSPMQFSYSTPFNKTFNSFELQPGTTTFTIEYTTQKLVSVGMVISAVSLLLLISIRFYKKK